MKRAWSVEHKKIWNVLPGMISAYDYDLGDNWFTDPALNYLTMNGRVQKQF